MSGRLRAPTPAPAPAPMIGVLGPPIVATSTGASAVGGLAGKLLVALSAADGAMTAERLIEVLWRSHPPPTARAALHVHLGTVRQVLRGEHDLPILERTGGGYQLRRGAWRLDFELASAHARQATTLLGRNPEAALSACRAALQLWRGAAYTVGDDVVVPVGAHRAATLRLELQELEVTALLVIGDAEEAARLALGLVDEEPYREQRWGQLLRARYHAGHVRDALATYQEARRVLADDLGVEPGPELRDLERAVLTHDDAALAVPPAHRQRQSLRLPPPGRGGPVFGRADDVLQCEEALASGRPVVIHGPPGVGKTTVAKELAHQHPDGSVLWVDLRAHTGARDVLSELAGAAHLAGAPAWARSGDVAMVVLDNAEHLTDATAEVITTLSAVAPAVGLVVTSRTRIPVDAVFLTLAPLPVPDLGVSAEDSASAPALLLLRAALADLAPAAQLSADDAVILCKKAGGLPLALRLTAAAARGVSIEDLTRGQHTPWRAGILDAVDATLALADADAATGFRRLGILRQAFDLEMAAAVTGVDRTQARELLVTLADYGLVQVVANATAPYSLLEPVRDAAEQLLVRAGEVGAAWHGLVGWTLHHARDLRAATMLGEASTAAAARIGSEMPRFHRVMDRLVDDGDHERALRLAQLLDAPLYMSGRWVDRNAILDRALSIPGPPSKERALVLGYRGRAGPFSAFDTERISAALDMATSVRASGVTSYLLHLRGIHYWWRGDMRAARADHDQAARWFQARDDPTAIEVRKFRALALVHDGEPEEAVAALRRAASWYRTRSATALCAHTLAYLGHCHRFLGDDDAALANWQEALQRFTAIGNSGTAVHVHLGLGEVAIERRDWYAGSRHAGAALRLIGDSGNTEYEAWGWTVALRAAAGAQDMERAVACASSALAVAHQVIPGEAARLASELAALAASVGDWRRAARLIGCADALSGPRELPFASPSEVRRWEGTRAAVIAALGSDVHQYVGQGRRCTVVEAAGSLVVGRSERATDRVATDETTAGTTPRVDPARRRSGDA